MSVQAYQTAFSIWLDANRSRLIYRLGSDTNLAKMARVEWMKMSEEDKNMWRKKTDISAQCLRGRLKKVKRKGTTKKTPSESIDQSDALSSLPPSILVRHILQRVSPAQYAQLHLVSRRFHHLLSNYADELPKRDLTFIAFKIPWEDELTCAGKLGGNCKNLNESRQSKEAPLMALAITGYLRHQKLIGEVRFDKGFELRHVLKPLIHLAKHKRLCMTHIEFKCCMSGVTEGQLKELLSHCSSRLEYIAVGTHADIGLGIITDALIASIVVNGRFRALCLSRPVGLTDLTLDHFPLIDCFHLELKHERITPSGVYRFIQRFRKEYKKWSGHLTICTSLEKPLRNLITPDEVRKNETWYEGKTTEWIFFKTPGNRLPPHLYLGFESC
uniref:F-box domain-containing protein n=1 Tax=Plectus sambesii TaxID=2011161 RepID=A0A914UVI7_9BILA